MMAEVIQTKVFLFSSREDLTGRSDDPVKRPVTLLPEDISHYRQGDERDSTILMSADGRTAMEIDMNYYEFHRLYMECRRCQGINPKN